MKKLKKSAAENLLKAVLDDLKAENASSTEDSGQATELYEKNSPTKTEVPAAEFANPVDQDKTAIITSIRKGFPPPREQLAADSLDDSGLLSKLIQAKKSIAANPLIQNAEYSRMAQQKIVELEKQNEILIRENERLSSELEVVEQKAQDLQREKDNFIKMRNELQSDKSNEVDVYREALDSKSRAYDRLRAKVDELENRLKQDFRRTKSRERELENLLEISKSEKVMITKYKDEMILDQKRKNDSLNSQIESQRSAIDELSVKIEGYQEQFSRTVRALRLALTQLEVHHEDTTSSPQFPLKKAE